MVNNLYKITYNIENKKVITTIEVEILLALMMGNVQSCSFRENLDPTLITSPSLATVQQYNPWLTLGDLW